ncbi:MAG: hypothetical protein Q8M79_12580, partial [Dehalococcoidia bacterium]|nr:hypothetical protein [Dehalococcoidia bacterium]
MNVGDTFIPVSLARGDHLHVVISSPTAGGLVAVVNLTSARWDSDTCCVLQPGDHPWVRHDTVALYSHSTLIAVPDLETGIARSVLRAHDPMGLAPLRRLQDGALLCEQT